MCSGFPKANVTGLQRDLEYDPAMYQRDRGDDWETQSISSSNILDTKSMYPDGGRSSPAPSKALNYDRYLAYGPQPEIEMTRLDIPDNQPLLNQVSLVDLVPQPRHLTALSAIASERRILRPEHGRKQEQC